MKIHRPISYIQWKNIENALPMHKMDLGIFSLAYIVRSCHHCFYDIYYLKITLIIFLFSESKFYDLFRILCENTPIDGAPFFH